MRSVGTQGRSRWIPNLEFFSSQKTTLWHSYLGMYPSQSVPASCASLRALSFVSLCRCFCFHTVSREAVHLNCIKRLFLIGRHPNADNKLHRRWSELRTWYVSDNKYISNNCSESLKDITELKINCSTVGMGINENSIKQAHTFDFIHFGGPSVWYDIRAKSIVRNKIWHWI